MDRLADPLVRAAAADISLHGNIDIGIAGFGIAPEQGDSAHDLSRLAVAALRHLLFHPGLLHGLRLFAIDAFYRRDLLTGYGGEREAAGPDGIPCQVHGTGAALGDPAAEFSSFQPYQVPYYPEQGHIGFGIDLDGLVIDGKRISGHKENFT
jgi:hypothetical protein